MIIQRRNFLIGLMSVLAAPAIVRAENIMPVRALTLPDDPLVRGVRWQSWPFDAPMPAEMCQGSIGNWSNKAAMQPLSHWLKALEKHRPNYPEMVWEPMHDVRYR